MSVAITWVPVERMRYLDVASCSDVGEALSITFGDFPLTLDVDSLPTLRAMAAAWVYDPNPYAQLIEAVTMYLEICVEWEV